LEKGFFQPNFIYKPARQNGKMKLNEAQRRFVFWHQNKQSDREII
jgi:hypothetical protein